MLWVLLGAVVGSTIAIIYLVWRKWIAPWRQVDRLVRQIGRGERPQTFLVEGGKEAQRVSVALEDIFSRQRELDRQAGERAAGQKAIFSAMQDGLLAVDRDRRIVLANLAFHELFAVGEGSLGAPLLESVRDPALEQIVGDTFRERAPSQGELIIGRREFQMTSVPMGNDNGDVRGAVILFHDISEMKRDDQIRSDFVANVSHELRTPLSILRGYIETLVDNPKTSREELTRILQVMERHSKRLGLLVEDLLSLAQLESSNTNLEIGQVRLSELSDHVLRDWKKNLARKSLKVLVDLPPDTPLILADETRLQEVLYNLLENAVKYSRANGEIRLQAAQRRSEIVLSVSDDGIGISKNDLPRIFERFYRADKARGRELGGTGLGLAIVKHIAQLHGGHVEAESEPGRGTSIRVVLPIATL